MPGDRGRWGSKGFSRGAWDWAQESSGDAWQYLADVESKTQLWQLAVGGTVISLASPLHHY